MRANVHLQFYQVYENMKEHFKFLFERDFRVISTVYIEQDHEGWQVILSSGKWLLLLHYCDWGNMKVGLTTVELLEPFGFFDLEIMLQHLEDESMLPESGRMEHTNQPQHIAQVLERNITDILETFERLSPQFYEPRRRVLPPNENGQLFMNNCPFFYFVFDNTVYSFTSPSMTSSPFGGVDGPPGVSGCGCPCE